MKICEKRRANSLRAEIFITQRGAQHAVRDKYFLKNNKKRSIARLFSRGQTRPWGGRGGNTETQANGAKTGHVVQRAKLSGEGARSFLVCAARVLGYEVS
jgi:hypothetical protein